MDEGGYYPQCERAASSRFSIGQSSSALTQQSSLVEHLPTRLHRSTDCHPACSGHHLITPQWRNDDNTTRKFVPTSEALCEPEASGRTLRLLVNCVFEIRPSTDLCVDVDFSVIRRQPTETSLSGCVSSSLVYAKPMPPRIVGSNPCPDVCASEQTVVGGAFRLNRGDRGGSV
ncbi:hypothetical protein BIW11_04044 [Tropilaelaps mercedesae]|uniref:Uncharacterized protein n=1 Tax=Tropilaelaps mercedesae TaxID=418985 RepID=A0A1V9XCJ2_9ACAR|nr:hypothetical protein BIW11_04044 [Tropilaelaps mercedesae]